MTKKFTSSRKEAYLEQFYQSGLTQTAFCKHQGLVFKTFNKWLKESKSLSVNSPHSMTHFQNTTTNTNQGAFIPVHLNTADMCEPPSHQPSTSPCLNVSHESVIEFKTNRFSLDIVLDLSTDYGQISLKSVIQMLHQLLIA